MRTSNSAQLVYTKIQVHKEHSFDYFVSFDLRESGIKKAHSQRRFKQQKTYSIFVLAFKLF